LPIRLIASNIARLCLYSRVVVSLGSGFMAGSLMGREAPLI
jgi:hypothetical protein